MESTPHFRCALLPRATESVCPHAVVTRSREESVKHSQIIRSLLVIVLMMLAASAFAESAGAVHGKVLGPDNKPMAGVAVQLRNDITGFKAQSITNADGAFFFSNVPFNPYELHVDVQGFPATHRSVDVRSIVPIDLTVPLSLPTVSESISVTAAEPPAAQLETDTS